VEVPLPTLLEQRRVVDLVSSVDSYIAALQQQADVSRAARSAVLSELLSAGGDDWTETTLGKIGLTGVFADGDWVESKDQDPAGEFRLLQLADVGDGVFLDKSNRWMNSEQFSRLHCTPLRPRDILIARMPDPIARACVVPSGLATCATVVDVAILRCGEGFVPEFVVLVINDSAFRVKAQSLLTGTTRQRISRSNLAKIVLVAPSVAEQRRIVEIVSSMDGVIRSAEQVVSDAKLLRSGLLSDLLSGRHEIPESYDRLLGAA
jgi:type I restriction enzyme S subunit